MIDAYVYSHRYTADSPCAQLRRDAAGVMHFNRIPGSQLSQVCSKEEAGEDWEAEELRRMNRE